MKLIRIQPVELREVGSDVNGARRFLVTSRDGEHHQTVYFTSANGYEEPDLRLVAWVGADWIARRIAARLRKTSRRVA